MNPNQQNTSEPSVGTLPEGDNLQRNIASRRTVGGIWKTLFISSMLIAIIALLVLLFTIIDKSFGYAAVTYKIAPSEVTDKPINELSQPEIITILEDNMRSGAFKQLSKEKPLEEHSNDELIQLLRERVLNENVAMTWTLYDSIFHKADIEATVAEKHPDARLLFRSWVGPEFLTTPMSSKPIIAGVRTALLGSLWMIVITMIIAFPIGVGAAIYLEEYATDNWLNRLIQTNINNLAGVPSIIYGMLGLAIFVRALEMFTSGSMFGVTGSNGRTILSASLTMALLILPIIIINGQEAIRAVPSSLRQASYGLGATKWQTIWNHVLPVAMPGILTGTILAMSRGIGETAPLIVVGASTFIATDPDGPFSKFTALPIIIYNWTSRPQDEFRNIAAAAIIILLILLLSLNSVAILLRNRFRKGGI